MRIRESDASFAQGPSSLRFGRAYTPQERRLANASNAKGLEALEKENFFVNIHDYSLPNAAGAYDPVGSPYSKGGKDFFKFAFNEGFNGVQFAPQGLTHAGDVSPYGANFFSRNTLSISFRDLVEDPKWLGLLSKSQFEAARKRHFIPRQASDDYQIRAYYKDDRRPGAGGFALAEDLLKQVYANYKADPGRFEPFKAELAAFRADNKSWLERDALFETLAKHHTEWTVDSWNYLDRTLYQHDDVHPLARPFKKLLSAAWKKHLQRKYRDELATYAFGQFIVHKQHQDFLKFTRTELARNGRPFETIGDLPIGASPAEEWAYGDLFMKSHRLGAPPSATGPLGQPWAFPILDPAKYERGGKDYMRRRVEHLTKRYSMLRIDHPHGYMDPWAYKHDFSKRVFNVFDKDSVEACFKLNTPNVQKGVRLFSAINNPDHPELAKYAKVSADQINPDPKVKGYDDQRVRDLKPEQVDRFGDLMDVLIQTAQKNGVPKSKIISEVLSTCPYPMWAVLEKNGLGRLRVIQKADPSPTNKEHVYRSENARPQDWVMTSTHDAPSIWKAAYNWFIPAKDGGPEDRIRRTHADYTAGLFYQPNTPEFKAFSEKLQNDRGEMVQARIAAALLSPSRNISLPFNDVLGGDLGEVRINNPEEARLDNWTLRASDDYVQKYDAALEQGTAANIPKAIALAMETRIRNGALSQDARALQRRLEYLGAVRAMKTGDAAAQKKLEAEYPDVVAALAQEKATKDAESLRKATPLPIPGTAHWAHPTVSAHPES